jgi:hypothetical protein
LKDLARSWSRQDRTNPALQRAIPVEFARTAVADNANSDLVSIAGAGAAISMDPLHNLVVSSRLADDANWTMAGFSIPMLFPDASTVPWAAIRDLRREKQLRRFRAVLREVEEEALDEVADGDVEAAIHHAYERHLANAQERISGLGWIGAWGVSKLRYRRRDLGCDGPDRGTLGHDRGIGIERLNRRRYRHTQMAKGKAPIRMAVHPSAPGGSRLSRWRVQWQSQRCRSSLGLVTTV